MHMLAAPLRQRQSSDTAGFTLLEVLVVVAILSVLAIVALPRLQLGRGPRFRATIHALAVDLRLQRDVAIRRGSPTTVTATATGYLLQPAGRARALPSGMTLEIADTMPMLLPRASAGVIFYPDGSSTGGTLSLDGSGGGVRLVVRSLDGRVRPDE